MRDGLTLDKNETLNKNHEIGNIPLGQPRGTGRSQHHRTWWTFFVSRANRRRGTSITTKNSNFSAGFAFQSNLGLKLTGFHLAKKGNRCRELEDPAERRPKKGADPLRGGKMPQKIDSRPKGHPLFQIASTDATLLGVLVHYFNPRPMLHALPLK